VHGVAEDEAVCELGGFGGEAECQQRAPVVGHDEQWTSGLVGVWVWLEVLLAHAQDEVGQDVQDLVWAVVGKAVGATVAGEVNGDENGFCGEPRVLQVVLPECPAVWEAMDEDDEAAAAVDA